MTSTAASRLRRGWFSDPECNRTTYRLQGALRILAQWGAKPEWSHSNNTYIEWGREKHCCDYRCTVAWPEWVTNDVLDSAYNASSTLQSARGDWNKAQASITRAALVAAGK